MGKHRIASWSCPAFFRLAGRVVGGRRADILLQNVSSSCQLYVLSPSWGLERGVGRQSTIAEMPSSMYTQHECDFQVRWDFIRLAVKCDFGAGDYYRGVLERRGGLEGLGGGHPSSSGVQCKNGPKIVFSASMI